MSENEDSKKPLLVVADTNLFFECQKLEDLPWNELGHDPITIVVTKPVLEEIDKHKKATGRTRDRALDIFGRFRKARQENQSEIVICDANPRVKLERRAATKPDKNLNGQLDYQLNDERLLGIVSTLASENPDKAVVFLSHDEGPIGLAEELDLGAHQIEDHWLRPTRQSDEQKKIDALKSELAKFQDSEPKFKITADGDRNDKGKLPFYRYTTIPLEAEEVQTLTERLKQKHPMRTDFSPPPPEVKDDHFRGMRVERTFSSPSAEDIDKYQKTEYPDWISSCTSILTELHETNAHPNEPFVMRFIATNVGSRPANKVRIDFKAKGGLLLRRIRRDDDDTDTEKPSTKRVTKLPPAPKPPAFEISVVTAELENPSDIAHIGRKLDRVGTDISRIMESIRICVAATPPPCCQGFDDYRLPCLDTTSRRSSAASRRGSVFGFAAEDARLSGSIAFAASWRNAC